LGLSKKPSGEEVIMMKKNHLVVAAVVMLILGAVTIEARPNRWAENGALDVFYASSEKKGLLSIGFFHLEGGYSNRVYGHEYTAIGFAPLSFLEFSLAVHADGFRNDDNHYLIGPIKLSPVLKGGYPLVKKYGKFLLISNKDLNRTEKWFSRYGNKTVFFSQLFPVIRTYISLPSGILKIKYLPFLIYTFLGAIIWSLLLVWLGMTFGQNWKVIQVYFKKFDLAISILVFAGLAFFIYHKISKFNKLAKEKN